MLNLYHNVVEAAETTGDSGSYLEEDFRGDRSLISVYLIYHSEVVQGSTPSRVARRFK